MRSHTTSGALQGERATGHVGMALSGVARSPAGEPGSQSDYRAYDYQCHDPSQCFDLALVLALKRRKPSPSGCFRFLPVASVSWLLTCGNVRLATVPLRRFRRKYGL